LEQQLLYAKRLVEQRKAGSAANAEQMKHLMLLEISRRSNQTAASF